MKKAFTLLAFVVTITAMQSVAISDDVWQMAAIF
jgi:hypothetical protein